MVFTIYVTQRDIGPALGSRSGESWLIILGAKRFLRVPVLQKWFPGTLCPTLFGFYDLCNTKSYWSSIGKSIGKILADNFGCKTIFNGSSASELVPRDILSYADWFNDLSGASFRGRFFVHFIYHGFSMMMPFTGEAAVKSSDPNCLCKYFLRALKIFFVHF